MVQLPTVTTLTDTTPPVYVTIGSVTYPRVGDIGERTAVVAIAMDEPGTAWFVVVSDGASSPSIAQVVAGTTGNGAPGVAAGTMSIGQGHTMYNVSIAGLEPDRKYVAYFAAQDAMGTPNVQVEATSVRFRALCQFIPRVVIQGPPVAQVRPSRGITLVAVPRPAGCIGSGLVHPMVVVWHIVSTDAAAGVDSPGSFTLVPMSQTTVDAATRATTDVRRLQLTPANLRVGHRYTLRVTSWSTLDRG